MWALHWRICQLVFRNAFHVRTSSDAHKIGSMNCAHVKTIGMKRFVKAHWYNQATELIRLLFCGTLNIMVCQRRIKRMRSLLQMVVTL
ncbi:hypothetical protein P879_11347 [Paragonimus westermani]|uniref:Uncharacterized protein n=1 Tax=Paragonimus westermani TaxID=34504 RepID=A0A8T0D403_9TREM|nr:hypothetical protein P879_11347 [Paragonimus westermani]